MPRFLAFTWALGTKATWIRSLNLSFFCPAGLWEEHADQLRVAGRAFNKRHRPVPDTPLLSLWACGQGMWKEPPGTKSSSPAALHKLLSERRCDLCAPVCLCFCFLFVSVLRGASEPHMQPLGKEHSSGQRLHGCSPPASQISLWGDGSSPAGLWELWWETYNSHCICWGKRMQRDRKSVLLLIGRFSLD